jgi:hypothetical protein
MEPQSARKTFKYQLLLPPPEQERAGLVVEWVAPAYTS